MVHFRSLEGTRLQGFGKGVHPSPALSLLLLLKELFRNFFCFSTLFLFKLLLLKQLPLFFLLSLALQFSLLPCFLPPLINLLLHFLLLLLLLLNLLHEWRHLLLFFDSVLSGKHLLLHLFELFQVEQRLDLRLLNLYPLRFFVLKLTYNSELLRKRW